MSWRGKVRLLCQGRVPPEGDKVGEGEDVIPSVGKVGLDIG